MLAKLLGVKKRRSQRSQRAEEILSINKIVISTLSEAEGEGSAVRRQMQIPRYARDDKGLANSELNILLSPSPHDIPPRLFRPINLGQQIRLRLVPHQVRIFFATVIIQFDDPEVIRVFHDELNRRRTGLRCPNGVVPDIG